MTRIALPLALLFVAGFLLALEFLPGYAPLGNLLLGAAIALSATYIVETWKRRQLADDLAVALYHELANRVMRCCYDFESPWSKNWEIPGRHMSRFSAGKFSPEPPTIFNANADKLALFGERVPSALMAFYFRLSVLRRDIENLREDARDHSDLGDDAVRVIGSRFGAALGPGLNALKALAPIVPDPAAIEADALETFDPGPQKRAEGTLRERLSLMIQKADQIRAKVESQKARL
jgi:hypothetical protein